VVEYGGGISHGPAGQVSGGGSHPLAQGHDVFSSVGQFADGAYQTLSTLSPIQLVGLIVVVFVGLIILRRVLF
jgi:hypothetical protein